MSDIKFSYTNGYNAYQQIIAFLQANGWSKIYERPAISIAREAFIALEGGTTKNWDAPSVIVIHWFPGVNYVGIQGFKSRGTIPKGLGDFFDNSVLNPLWTDGPPGKVSETTKLNMIPVVGTWDALNTDYTYCVQDNPGSTYAIKAAFEPPTVFGGGDTYAAGVCIRNISLGNVFARLYVEKTPGIYQVKFDTYDGVAYTLHASTLALAVTPQSFYLEQLGGIIYAYFRFSNIGPWTYLGHAEVDERDYFDGNEEVGMFTYASTVALETDWTEFRWAGFEYGLGQPLHHGDAFSVTPTVGDCTIFTNDTRAVLYFDQGATDLLYMGSFRDHTGSREYDSRVTLIKPKDKRVALYVEVGDTPKFREGLTPENAEAALGQPYDGNNLVWQQEYEPQARDTTYFMHPYFVGIQFDGKQISGETSNLYITDDTIAPPVDGEFVTYNSLDFVYYEGFVIGPITSFASVGATYDAGRLTWVDPTQEEDVTQYLPTPFVVREGYEQPQIVIEWGEPPKSWDETLQMIIRRKLTDYPYDETDGDLIYTGTGEELGYSDQTVLPGDFYYYKVFILTLQQNWVTSTDVQGNAFSWESGKHESLIFNSLSQGYKLFQSFQPWLMAATERSPEQLNFLEDSPKGFITRIIKNFGLEFDRIEAYHEILNLVIDPIKIKLEWMNYLGSRYAYSVFQGDLGIQQKWGLLFWPYLLRKKGTEAVLAAITEQVTSVVPVIINGADRVQLCSWSSYMWDPGAADPAGGFVNANKMEHEDDPNFYIPGFRSVYNDKGIFIYLTGTFTQEILAELRAKLSFFTPATSVIAIYVNDVLSFTLQLENGDGSL